MSSFATFKGHIYPQKTTNKGDLSIKVYRGATAARKLPEYSIKIPFDLILINKLFASYLKLLFGWDLFFVEDVHLLS